ncbi:MAG TPA: hypothetical protein VKX39_08820 [Bryobacteraceae bacterium]|jgi:hypothetical protein|nr:hypothetical protein [Bryobacteraceae bacterium]
MTKPRRASIHRDAADLIGVSHFHKLNGNSFRVWAPEGAPCRIEYSTAVLRQARLQSARENAEGVLYGRCENGSIRVVAARPAPDAADPRLSGLDPIGIFAARLRGEVFLTERDLERFEKIESGAVVALVIAGSRAGFFVHEPDGSLQSIKSHLEFSLDEPPPELERPAPAVAPTGWNWKPFAVSALIAIAISLWIASSRVKPQARPPVALTLHDENLALRIAWNPAAIPAPATLEIVDGGVQQSIDIAGLNGLTYARRSGQVTVRLAGETARFTGADPPVPPLDRLREQVAELDAETRDLKTVAAIRTRRIAEMERILSKMDLAH